LPVVVDDLDADEEGRAAEIAAAGCQLDVERAGLA